MRHHAWPLALAFASALAFAEPALAAPADSVSAPVRPRIAAPT